MDIFYNIAGTVNSMMVLLSLAGAWSQLRLIWQRNLNPDVTEKTELLSLNNFSVGFFAYYSAFVYGFSIEPFNHYVVWSRLLACILVLFILFEIRRDRRTLAARFIYNFSVGMLILAVAAMLFLNRIQDQGRLISLWLMLTMTVMIGQGALHQILLIIRNGKTGALDYSMQLFLFCMHASTACFGVAMGWHNGWPFLVLAATGITSKGVILYLFRWTRISPAAEQRREANAALQNRM